MANPDRFRLGLISGTRKKKEKKKKQIERKQDSHPLMSSPTRLGNNLL